MKKNTKNKNNKQYIKRRRSYRLAAGFTVEAALVMAVTLFLIAALLTEAFAIHGDVVGDMVLQDALEQSGHLGEKMTVEEIVRSSNRRLKTYFRCGDRALSVEKQGLRMEGMVSGASNHQIFIKQFEPETFLRLLRAVGV